MAVNLRALRTRGLASSGPYPLQAAPTQATGTTTPGIQSDPALVAGPAQLADALGGLMQPAAAAPAGPTGSAAAPRIISSGGTSSPLPSPGPSTPGTPSPTTPSTPKPQDNVQANWTRDYSAAAAMPAGQRYAFWLTKGHYASTVYRGEYARILEATKASATQNKLPGTQTRTF